MMKVHFKPAPFSDHRVLTPQFLTSHLIFVNKGKDLWLDNQIGQGETALRVAQRTSNCCLL